MFHQSDPPPANEPESPQLTTARIANYLYTLDRGWADEQAKYAWQDWGGGWHYTPNNWIANVCAVIGGLALLGGIATGEWKALIMAGPIFLAAAAFIAWQWHRYHSAKGLYERLRQEALDLVPPGMHINPDGEYRAWGKK